MAGRIGADERDPPCADDVEDDSCDPVATFRTEEEDAGCLCTVGLVGLCSEKVDWADSGRGGRFLAAASRAFFCAAIVSFKVILVADDVCDCPLREVVVFEACAAAFGFPESFSRRDLDFVSNSEIMLYGAVRKYILPIIW